nr:MAG TPA: hypothetical protein [Caudoviricetes sp.]
MALRVVPSTRSAMIPQTRVESVVTTANYTDVFQAGEHGWSEVLLTTTPLL